MNIELGHAQSGNFELHCVKGLAIHCKLVSRTLKLVAGELRQQVASVCQISVSVFAQCSKSIGRRSISVGMQVTSCNYEIP